MSEVRGPTYFYIHTAKTAGQAITSVLVERYGGEACTMKLLPAAVAAGAFIFTSVRNPFDRCLSLWHSLIGAGDYYKITAAGKTEPVACMRYISSGDWRRRSMEHPAGHLDKTCSEHIGDVKLDAVLHFETLLEDFNRLPFVTEPLAELPISNRKSWGNNHGRPERWPLELPEFLQVVREWCKDDFIRFNYDIDKIPEEVH